MALISGKLQVLARREIEKYTIRLNNESKVSLFSCWFKWLKKPFMGIIIKEESIHYYFQNFKVHRGEG